jgi:carboxylesterase
VTTVGLLHGLGGTAATMAPLAELLQRRGLDVTCPTLPGHGGSDDALRAATWADWLAAVPRVPVLVGQSMGATLALAAAATRTDVQLVIAINPVLADPDAAEGLEWQVSRGLEWIDAPLADGETGNARLPVQAVLQMVHGALSVTLTEVRVPVVLATGALDDTADPWALDALAAQLGGPVQRLVLPGSGHVTTFGPDLELLMEPIERLTTRSG